MVWQFTKEFLRGWTAFALIVVGVAGAFSVTVLSVPVVWVAVAALVVSVFTAYQLWASQEKRITQLEGDVWLARNGTSLYVECAELPITSMYGQLFLDRVYVVNRRQDHPANVRFALVAGGERMEAEEKADPAVAIPSPAHVDAGANRMGQVIFRSNLVSDLTPFVIEGVQLEIRDEQTGYVEAVDLPTDGAEAVQGREV